MAGAVANRPTWPVSPRRAHQLEGEQAAARSIVPSTSILRFAPGSPEETYLRDNTRYLTHGWGGPVAAICACSWGSCGIC